MHSIASLFASNIFADISSTTDIPLRLTASTQSTATSAHPSIVNEASSSSESSFPSTTIYPLASTSTEADSSGIETTVVPTEEIAETVNPFSKITTISSQSVAQAVETNTKADESVVSSTSITIITETTPSTHIDEISHREHGRALNLTNVAAVIPVKAKGLNDLSDVSMDDDNFGDGNGAKEEMVIAQTKHKECESKVSEIWFGSY